MKKLLILFLIIPTILSAQNWISKDTVFYKWLGHDSIMFYGNDFDTATFTNPDKNIDVDAASRKSFTLVANTDTVVLTTPLQYHYLKIGTALYKIDEVGSSSIQIIIPIQNNNWHSYPYYLNNFYVFPQRKYITEDNDDD